MERPAPVRTIAAQAVEELRVLAQSDPQIEPLLEQVSRMQAGYQELLVERDALIAEQKPLIEQLKRMLFGPKSEQLTPEQETQLAEVVGDLQEQVARRVTDSEEVLTDETESEQKEDRTPWRPRQRRPLLVELEVITSLQEIGIQELEPSSNLTRRNCQRCQPWQRCQLGQRATLLLPNRGFLLKGLCDDDGNLKTIGDPDERLQFIDRD